MRKATSATEEKSNQNKKVRLIEDDQKGFELPFNRWKIGG
jgi:hypothetical protein